MEKIKQCLFHAVKLLPYGFMLLIAIICYELKFSEQQEYEESEEK